MHDTGQGAGRTWWMRSKWVNEWIRQLTTRLITELIRWFAMCKHSQRKFCTSHRLSFLSVLKKKKKIHLEKYLNFFKRSNLVLSLILPFPSCVFHAFFFFFFAFYLFPSCVLSQLTSLNGQFSNFECHLNPCLGHIPDPSKHKCSNLIKCMASHLCFNIKLLGKSTCEVC